MAFDGESITQLFYFVPNDPTPPNVALDLPASTLQDCCNEFSLKVLADSLSNDEFKNDKSGFLFGFNNFVSGAILKLQKFQNGAFADIATLNNITYGTDYNFGFFVDSVGDSYIGYQLLWKNVLTINGVGSYKIKCEVTSAIGGTTNIFSPIYCLKQYTAELADVTIKVEYFLNGIIGNSSNDYITKDFGKLNWYNAYRLNGFFGFPKSTYTSDYVKYNNGQRAWVEDEQEPEYVMKLKPTPAYIHEIMRTDVLQADTIFITDYNSKNPLAFIKKEVIKNSDYSPDWKILQSKLAPVELSFKQAFNNLKKNRC